MYHAKSVNLRIFLFFFDLGFLKLAISSVEKYSEATCGEIH